ncbi:MAG: CPBP family intramembrane metalloprotease [Anaerolineae bacterium]|nr:CPBP family intramembrane metalloprotease [Anaerolineae bacterium]
MIESSISQQPPLDPAHESPAPSMLGRWLLVGTLLSTHILLQLVGGVAYFYWMTNLAVMPMSVDELLADPSFNWAALLAAGFAAVMTVFAALIWPVAWGKITSSDFSFAEWFSWQKPRNISLWVVPGGTIIVMMIVGYGVSALVGPTEVEAQQGLFSTLSLAFASTITVTTVVPLAEELLFRGALYNALLNIASKERPAWLRHVLPFVVSVALFAGAHLLTGFVNPGSIVSIILLSAFLTGLRALTGSLWPSLVAHIVWNGTAAIGALLMS